VRADVGLRIEEFLIVIPRKFFAIFPNKAVGFALPNDPKKC